MTDRNHITGVRSELKIMDFFIELECPVYLPILTQSKADLVVDINHKLYKVQVKTVTWVKSDKYSYCGTRLRNRNKYTPDYTDGDFDILACYDPITDRIWLFTWNIVKDKTSIYVNKEGSYPFRNGWNPYKYQFN